MPRVDVEGTSVDWLNGVVRGNGVAETCVVTGKVTDECVAAAPPSGRAAEHDAADAVLRRVMTLVLKDTCSGYDAMQRDPSLRDRVRSSVQTSSQQVDREVWRAEGVLRLDLSLVRAFRSACAPHARAPHVFSVDEEQRLLQQVEDLLAARSKRTK